VTENYPKGKEKEKEKERRRLKDWRSP